MTWASCSSSSSFSSPPPKSGLNSSSACASRRSSARSWRAYLVGPYVLGWIQPDETTFAMSELGVLFLLFLVGLETKPRDL